MDSPVEEKGFKQLVPRKKGRRLMRSLLIDLPPLLLGEKKATPPPRGTESSNPLPSSGESDARGF